MSRIENFSKFTSEGLASTGSKMRRIVTGQSAGDELEKLSNEQQQKLVDLYNQDPTEAAKYLRSIIIKEKNSQFGLGLALTLAGAALIYKAINEPPVDPPNPPPHVPGKLVDVDYGDGIPQFLNKTVGGPKLGPESDMDLFVAKVKQLGGSYELGCKYLTDHIVGPDHDQILGVLKSIGANPHERGDTLGEVFQGTWKGTGKSIGDLFDWKFGTKVFVPDSVN